MSLPQTFKLKKKRNITAILIFAVVIGFFAFAILYTVTCTLPRKWGIDSNPPAAVLLLISYIFGVIAADRIVIAKEPITVTIDDETVTYQYGKYSHTHPVESFAGPGEVAYVVNGKPTGQKIRTLDFTKPDDTVIQREAPFDTDTYIEIVKLIEEKKRAKEAELH